MKGFYYFSIFLAVLSAGCGVWDDSPGVPHVIVVPEFELITTVEEGTNSHAVEEVWVYTPTDVLGVFPLPATIPVVYDNESESLGLTISAGIKANGIASTRRVYTFYDAIEVDYQYVPGSTDTVGFITNYIDAANIILAEDFESSNKFQASTQNSNPPFLCNGGFPCVIFQKKCKTNKNMETTLENWGFTPPIFSVHRGGDSSAQRHVHRQHARLRALRTHVL